jgi:hypothetical protein
MVTAEIARTAAMRFRTTFCTFVTVAVVAFDNASFAQQPASQTQTSAAASTIIRMEEPQPGDHWAYEIRDEISGKTVGIRDNVVTEVAPTGISVRFKMQGTSNEGFNLYDRLWNLKKSGQTTYSPHDGTSGIPASLTVGNTWTFQSSMINSNNGNAFKRSGSSKIVGQETITTKAGTFETFKIETSFTVRNANNPTGKSEFTFQTWYSPAIDHWVKRITIVKSDGHLRENNTLELVDYGRKQ